MFLAPENIPHYLLLLLDFDLLFSKLNSLFEPSEPILGAIYSLLFIVNSPKSIFLHFFLHFWLI